MRITFNVVVWAQIRIQLVTVNHNYLGSVEPSTPSIRNCDAILITCIAFVITGVDLTAADSVLIIKGVVSIACTL